MTGYSDSLGETASYSYYADGLRCSNTIGSNTYKYYYNGDDLINDTKNGNRLNTYVMGADGYINREHGSSEDYYFKNLHGDVTFAFNSGKWRSSEYNYYAWGAFKTNYDYFSDANYIRYSGQFYDKESNLIYLRARYYDNEIMRFITEDPAKDGLNWYAYCGNNPVMFVDPWGLDAYIIYDINGESGDGKHSFADEAEIKRQELVNTWGTTIHVIGVSNAEEFRDAWNNKVGYDAEGNDVSIEEVYIIAHGSITGTKENDTAQSYFVFSEDGSAVFANNDEGFLGLKVSDLAWKKLEHLTFSTCNSGNPDVYNLAYAFKLRMTIEYIHAWDGGTVFNYKQKRLLRGGYDSGNWKQDIKGQDTWYKYVDKYESGEPVRRRIGYRLIYG